MAKILYSACCSERSGADAFDGDHASVSIGPPSTSLECRTYARAAPLGSAVLRSTSDSGERPLWNADPEPCYWPISAGCWLPRPDTGRQIKFPLRHIERCSRPCLFPMASARDCTARTLRRRRLTTISLSSKRRSTPHKYSCYPLST
jgi:hypothetical protein